MVKNDPTRMATKKKAAKGAPLPSPEGLYVETGAAVWFQSTEHMWLPCTVVRGCRSKFEDVVL
eukprot:COSAG06_NODE_39721_length_409_cov_1.164516_1_plen_62_part_10